MLNTLFSKLLDTVINSFSKKYSPTEDSIHYDNTRKKVSKALHYYADCYSNPIDISKSENHELPRKYNEGRDEMRKLASELKSISETVNIKKERCIKQSKEEIIEASKKLTYLSNSFTAPYGQPCSDEQRRLTEYAVYQIKKNLSLS